MKKCNRCGKPTDNRIYDDNKGICDDCWSDTMTDEESDSIENWRESRDKDLGGIEGDKMTYAHCRKCGKEISKVDDIKSAICLNMACLDSYEKRTLALSGKYPFLMFWELYEIHAKELRKKAI
jgi:ribosomal protein L37E